MVPAMTALVSIYGFFADPAALNRHLDLLQGLVPPEGLDVIREQLGRLTEAGQTGLGLASIASIAVALWSANAGMKALFEAMNVAYNEEEKRSFVRLTLVTLGFTLAALVAILLLVGVGVVLPIVLQLVGVGTGAQWAARIGGIAVAFLLMVGGLAALYRWGPSRASAKWRWITPGAMLAIPCDRGREPALHRYVASFGSYNATYGSLGALFGLMTWLWISTIIVIAGAELNSETEHQTARDTTTGPPRPMGRRGAFMADTIGEPYGAATPDRSGPASADAPRDREPPLLTRVAMLAGLLWLARRSRRRDAGLSRRVAGGLAVQAVAFASPGRGRRSGPSGSSMPIESRDHVRDRAAACCCSGRQLAVGGRGGVDDERAGVAEVRHVAEELDGVHELHAGLVAALERKGEERAGAVRIEPLRPLVPGEDGSPA